MCVFTFAGVSFHASWDEMLSCVKDVLCDYKQYLEVCVYLRLLECLSMHPGMICRRM